MEIAVFISLVAVALGAETQPVPPLTLPGFGAYWRCVKAALLVQAEGNESSEIAADKALLSCPKEEHALFEAYVADGGQDSEEQFVAHGRSGNKPIVVRRIIARRQVLEARRK